MTEYPSQEHICSSRGGVEHTGQLHRFPNKALLQTMRGEKNVNVCIAAIAVQRVIQSHGSSLCVLLSDSLSRSDTQTPRVLFACVIQDRSEWLGGASESSHFHWLHKERGGKKVRSFLFFFTSAGLCTFGLTQKKCRHNFFIATIRTQALVHRCHKQKKKLKKKKKGGPHNIAVYRVHLYKNIRPTHYNIEFNNTSFFLFLLRVRNLCLTEWCQHNPERLYRFFLAAYRLFEKKTQELKSCTNTGMGS